LIGRLLTVLKQRWRRPGAGPTGRTLADPAERRMVVEELARLTREGRHQEAVDLAGKNLRR
jgi:hypothetical protein